jgi:hypothetical protein
MSRQPHQEITDGFSATTDYRGVAFAERVHALKFKPLGFALGRPTDRA